MTDAPFAWNDARGSIAIMDNDRFCRSCGGSGSEDVDGVSTPCFTCDGHPHPAWETIQQAKWAETRERLKELVEVDD